MRPDPRRVPSLLSSPPSRGGATAGRAVPILVFKAVATALFIVMAVLTAAGVGAASPAAAATIGRMANAAAQAPADELPDPEPAADAARREADEILARPEYQEPPKSLTEKVWAWLGEQLMKLFSSFTGGSGGALAWVILAVLVGVAVFLVSRIRGGVRHGRGDPDNPLYSTALESRRSPDEWLAEAERHEAAGAWKEALRCRYRALIGHLIAAQILRDIPGRTIGEYRFEIRRTAPLAAGDFAAASDLFERAWYGDEPTGPPENTQFRSMAATILDRASRRDEPASTGVPV